MSNFNAQGTKLSKFIAPTSVIYDLGNDNVLRIHLLKLGVRSALTSNVYTSSSEEKAILYQSH